MKLKKPYTNSQYADLACYCNENDCHIEDMGDYLESVKNQHSKNEQIMSQILELKAKLADTDYKAIKYAEGWYSDEEYAEEKALRESWREQIREWEAQIEPEQTGENSTSDGD